MSHLFSIKTPDLRNNSSPYDGVREASQLIPIESDINIIKKFPWTLSRTSQAALDQTPFIKLNEFYLTDSALNQALKAYNKPIRSGGLATAIDLVTLLSVPNSLISETENNLLYENLYDHTVGDSDNSTGFSYTFPYFENSQNTQNNWVARSSYDFMIQLQRTLAEVQAQTDYLNLAIPPSSNLTPDDYLKAYDQLLQGNFGAYFTNPVFQKELLAKGAETIGPQAPYLQTLRQGMIDFYTVQVDIERTVEQLQIALKTGTGNIGEDPILDKPHIWSSSQPRVFTINFPLFNIDPYDTNNPNKTIERNWELCYLLTYQNSYNKKNLYTGQPPVFYEVEVPGVYYTKAAYVANISILNVGNIRCMNIQAGSGSTFAANIPDAYFLTLTLVDFFMPSRNFLDTLNNSSKRQAVKQSGS